MNLGASHKLNLKHTYLPRGMRYMPVGEWHEMKVFFLFLSRASVLQSRGGLKQPVALTAPEAAAFSLFLAKELTASASQGAGVTCSERYLS